MIIFFSFISQTTSQKLYQSICKERQEENFEQRCLKLIEKHPKITLTKDYLEFSTVYLKEVAIGEATKAEKYVNQFSKKYPSSEVIKGCLGEYGALVEQLKVASGEDAEIISLTVMHGIDALKRCETILPNEKKVDVSSIIALNRQSHFVAEIALIASDHL